MSSAGDGLMKAILENPEDDVPRLIFADWLEDNGDPDYAVFIRTQVALAKVPEYDPLWVRHWHTDRNAISGAAFEGRRPELPAGLTWAIRAFQRGFPSRVQVRNVSDFVANAPALFAAAPIRALEVHAEFAAPPPNLSALADSPYLAQLRELTFRLSRLPAEEVQRLQDSSHAVNLAEVAFEFAGIDPGALATLFRAPLMTRITRLQLHSNSIPWSVLSTALRDVDEPSRPRSLTLTETTTVLGDTQGVFGAPLFRSLVELNLFGHTLGAAGMEALAASSFAAGLRSLGLNKTAPGVPGVRALAECAALSGLRQLELANNRLGPVAIKHLARSPCLENLHVLDLSQNPIGDKGATALAESPHLRNLLQLELMDCEIGDAGAQALLDSPLTAGIVWLSVESSRTRLSNRMKKKMRERFESRVLV